MIPAREALERLREGNRRFVDGVRASDEIELHVRRSELTAGQEPIAIVLGCSDSRVPAEIVFGHGLGDLFVIRVAGNIVAPSQVGSIEFAADRFGTRLVVVLGHTMCGAVQAAIEALRTPAGSASPNVRTIVDRILPSVAPLVASDDGRDPERLMHDAVRANVRTSVAQLQHGSELIESLVQSDGLLIVGAEYSLETGAVDFFDGLG